MTTKVLSWEMWFVCRLLIVHMDHFGISFLIILMIVLLFLRAQNFHHLRCCEHVSLISCMFHCYINVYFIKQIKNKRGITFSDSNQPWISFALFSKQRSRRFGNTSRMMLRSVLVIVFVCSLRSRSPVCQPIDWKFVGEIFSTSTCKMMKNKSTEQKPERTNKRQKNDKNHQFLCVWVLDTLLSVMYARICAITLWRKLRYYYCYVKSMRCEHWTYCLMGNVMRNCH